MTLLDFIPLATIFTKWSYSTLALEHAFKLDVESVAKWDQKRVEDIAALCETLFNQTKDQDLKVDLESVRAKCLKARSMQGNKKSSGKKIKEDRHQPMIWTEVDEDGYDTT